MQKPQEPVQTGNLMRHPLDPLSATEILTITQLIKSSGRLDAKTWFETISLYEPLRQEVRQFNQNPSYKITRKAYVCCYQPKDNGTYQLIVNLETKKIESCNKVKHGQARIIADEFFYAGKVIKQHTDFIMACQKRGITDMHRVLVEPWAAGNFGLKSEQNKRIAYGHCWYSSDDGKNPYARPILGLHPVIDLQHMELLRVEDYGAAPLPPEPVALTPVPRRSDIKKYQITQPDGVSFELQGYQVKWQKWQFRIGYDVREGLILHDICYQDDQTKKLRPIIYRAAMAEMVVPYGHPGPGHFRRNAFDNGEYGVGQFFDSLKLGCDCLGEIRYLDAYFHDWQGGVKHIKNAICLHEEDYGLLWKFTNTYSDDLATYRARSRRMVVSTLSTIGNYVYGFFWYFYQDGTIGVEIKATGIPFPSGLTHDKKPSGYGVKVAPLTELHTHQHCFCYRFDMAVDGDENAVREVNFTNPAISKNNPHGNAIVMKETVLKTEKSAARSLDFAKQRYWRVVNPKQKNAMGQIVGYKLVTGTNAPAFLAKNSSVGKRAGFLFKHFWATQFQRDEKFPAGWFPNQHKGGDGLPRWIKKNRPLENKELVVWHTINFHHYPRIEDWPIQPVLYVNFHWMADGFFNQNPSMDI